MANYELKLKYCRNISNSARSGISSLDISDGAVKVQAAAWSHDGKLFAFVNAAKRLYIYDAEDLSTHKEVFSLKAKEKNALFGVQSFVVKGIAFHPSGTKIAIAQSDDVVFMYRFQSSPGVWDGKKSICNKFLFESTPTCIYWPRIELGQEFDKCFFVGNLQGEVRKCKTNSKKTQGDFLIPQKIVPPHHAFVCALAPNPENAGFVASYADGLIVIWAESNGQYVKMGSMKHSVAAYALATTNSAIVAAGADMRIAVYRRGAGGGMSSSMAGELMQSFDYSSDKTEKEFTCACSSAISETVAVASYDRVRTFNWNATSEKFVELSPMEIKNLYTITVLQWRPDGTNILLGTHTGLVEMLEVSSPKSVVNGVFEIQYFGPKQVLVRNTKKNTRCVLRSQYNYPITKVNVCGGKSSDVNIAGNPLTSDKRNRYLVAYTSDTLLIADFLDGRMSEVQWTSGGNEKFYFEIEKVCVIFNAGEMSLVEYGNNEFLGTVRTEFTNPHQFSVRINERTVAGSDNHDNKKLAYLVDLKTIEIVDLMGEAPTVRCQHASKIKWLELNETGRKLLFRDVKYKLYLLDVKSEEKVTMLDLCQFVQWVPQSDVIVAQNREFLCVWYNIDSPDKVSMFPIKGEVREVLRELVRETDGRERVQTRVLVDEKLDMAEYLLDSDLIAFGAAVESGQLTAAMNYLENLDATPETAAHWRTLAKLSLDQLRIPIAQRCYAELGDIAKARYLKKIVDMAHSRGFEQYEPEDASLDHDTKMAYMWRNLVEREPDIKAKILMLKKDFFMAQNTYLENDMLDDAIQMFVKIGKWEQALQLASERNHPDLDKLRTECKEWLKVHHQQEKIAALYESEGQYESAIFEYVKAGMPSKAANQMMKRQELMSNSSLLDTVIKELCEREFYIKAGELYEKAKVNDRALKLYRMAKDKEGFSNAVRLAREHDLGVDARDLLEEYADYLYEHMEFEMAMEKYLQASELIKALKSAFRANSIVRAEDIFETIKESPGGKESFDRVKGKSKDGEEELSYNGWAIKLGQYYATLPSGNRERNMKKAQKYFLEANSLEHIIQMYKDAGYWEKAFEYLVEIGATKEATEFLEEQAQICINEKRYSDAERVYTKGKMFESIVEMYKAIEDFDNVLRVQRRLGMGNDTSMLIEHAERRKRDGDFYEAEKLYMEAGSWKEAVNMYMQQGKWEDARRVCQEVGTEESRSKEGFIGYCWAKDMPSVVNAAKLLLNLNLLDKVVEVSCNAIASELPDSMQVDKKVPDFDMAFDLCNAAERPDLTARVHLLKGQFLEDQGQFQLAETEFIAAGKPNEALLMYIHEGMLDAAQKVADAHCTVEEKNQVYTALGNKKFEKGDYDSAEKLFLKSDNVEHLVSLYLDINRLDKVHDLADRGYLTPEQLNNLSAMRRREPMSSGAGASGSVGAAGDISGMSGASKIVEANRLASNTNSPHDMREALKLLFSITSYDVTATATSSVDEQLLHYNQQAMKVIETLCIQNGGRFVENLGTSRGDGPFRDSTGQTYTMKLSDVVSTVLTRQTSLQGDWKKGVSLCLNLYNALTKVNMVEEGDKYVDFAVKFACVHQQYSAASKIVNHAYEEDHPVARELLQYIKQQAVDASRQEGDMEGLVAMGEGFDELKQTGDYARYLDLVHKKDRENGTTNMPGALRKCIRSLLDQVESAGDSKRNANLSKLFSIMEDYGPLADNSQDVRNVFKAIFEKLTSSPMPGVEVLSTQPEDYKPAAFRNEWTVEYSHFDKMRKILLKEVDSNVYSGDMLTLISTLFVVCHLSANRAACMTASKLYLLAAKVSMAMTMYIHEVPADKVFLEAGIVARLASMSTNEEIPEERKDFLRKMAFLFVNTFIDTVEQAMEGETDFSSEYLGDLEPIRERGEILVPKNAQQCVLKDESVFESLKDWVLTVSMDNSIDFSSDMSIANNASSSDSGQVFEACPATSQGEKICCITGYPIKKPGGSDIRAVGSYAFSINNSDRGLLQTAKMVGGMGNDSFEDRETIKKLTNDDFDFLVKKMGVNSQF